jgi:hypothetical protein
MYKILDFASELKEIGKPCCVIHDEEPIEHKLAKCRVVNSENATYSVMYRKMLETLLDRHNGNVDSSRVSNYDEFRMMRTVLSPKDITDIQETLKADPYDYTG